MVFGKFRAKRPILNKILNINSKSNFKERQRRPKESPALAPRRPAPYFMGMKLTDAIKKFFRRRHADETAEQQPSSTPQPLRIEGVKPAPLTPEPDDAELAAQALLETLASPEQHRNNGITEYRNSEKQDGKADQPRDAAYYRRLAERIRLARDQATLRTMRFVTWCEHELEKRDLPVEGKGSLGQMEAELYKRIDTIERVGGELKHRWQHCLAEVIVRRMGEERENEELSESWPLFDRQVSG